MLDGLARIWNAYSSLVRSYLFISVPFDLTVTERIKTRQKSNKNECIYEPVSLYDSEIKMAEHSIASKRNWCKRSIWHQSQTLPLSYRRTSDKGGIFERIIYIYNENAVSKNYLLKPFLQNIPKNLFLKSWFNFNQPCDYLFSYSTQAPTSENYKYSEMLFKSSEKNKLKTV